VQSAPLRPASYSQQQRCTHETTAADRLGQEAGVGGGNVGGGGGDVVSAIGDGDGGIGRARRKTSAAVCSGRNFRKKISVR
jgi:hypothetical protein